MKSEMGTTDRTDLDVPAVVFVPKQPFPIGVTASGNSFLSAFCCISMRESVSAGRGMNTVSARSKSKI